MSTYSPIATQTLSSAAASVTFSSIPQGYTDLVLVCAAKSASGASSDDVRIYLRFNSDSGSNYSTTYMTGDGTTAASFRDSNRTQIDNVANISTNGSSELALFTYSINSYSSASVFKSVIQRGGNNSNATTILRQTGVAVSTWRNTNAITSIGIFGGAGNSSVGFASGSTFSLYGIQVGNSAQKAQGGNIVTSDGTYVYHTFTSSGSFTTNQALTVDYLVVAGGGGGGGPYGGGGGAGGLRSTVTATGGGGSLESALSLSLGKSYPVIIGAGGVGGGNTSGSIPAKGTSGSNSIFGSITSNGGGGGGAGDSATLNDGITGGSGGAAGRPATGTVAGAAALTSPTTQGYAGGSSTGGGQYNTGGGGGSGSVGVNAPATINGANGGSGTTVAISGSSVAYAGGGGGHAWISGTAGVGQAGGGNGGITNSTAATSATINSGSGGGGGTAGTPSNTGGNGGSGIVIIRYAI